MQSLFPRLRAVILTSLLFASLARAADDTPATKLPAVVAPPLPAPAEPTSPAVEASVVKIFATVRYPDPFKPWTKQAPFDATGTGMIIEGKRILTNAHVVLY